ncbi:carboxypeptidase-like regulatory domain-containing protein [Fibrella forsythiae]|uniref:Carboxypeptidase-like regulatory domain-containing protein n=1 Tax=Fibrella forsythiae TaxID=2817061 RepID=A0ABS3JN88_9BACT|nr:carboxypeptidase-like regulatory domain-containing protein [Fibrella forsythiae]MBO0950357.1 carboxypeptidase-like regulatory domain-containing protein [Fibrella forsythiae]
MMRRLHQTVSASCLFILLLSVTALAQTKLSGKITDAVGLPIPGASLKVKGKVTGTITDSKGDFSLTTNTPPPFTLVISSVGFAAREVAVTGSTSTISVRLDEQILQGQEIVVSASRVEESVMKSPVAVEKMDIRAIRETPAANFYDGLANFKGVDMATQGLLFKSINMRGFGATGNPRTVQMIDGMDNSAPGLNFPVDNIVGMPELDVESVEILPGAASALYGPNAINGLILMNSKSPFLYQGLSANVKTGLMNASNRSTATTGFYDGSIRYAKAFNNKLAFKLNLSYIKADDWQATNYNNLNINGAQAGVNDPARGAGVAPNYDGVNVYGDEAQANLLSVGQSLVAANRLPAAALGLLPSRSVSRTGYKEQDLVDYNTKSLKFNGAVHYRITEKAELIGQLNYGQGTTVYTGASRYSLRNFSITQAKLELRGSNYSLRAYTTQERSGDSYAAGLASIYMNEAWKPSTQWFGEYTGAFAQARGAGQTEEQALITARGVADQGRPLPGTSAYQNLFETYRNRPISQGGGAFLDKSNLYHAEGVYNFKDIIKFADVLVGANVRQYQLGSEGTLFADQAEGRTGRININEFGAFAQVGKNLLSDHLKITGSLRYDKNQNFEGQFTPRVSAVTTFGDHNVRLSYQTGFRIPTTQNQYIDLQTPNARLIGALPEFYTRYNLSNSYTLNNVSAVGADITKALADPATEATARALITQQVTAQVTSGVQAGVAAGTIPASVSATVIQQQVAAALPGAITANLTATKQGVAVLNNYGKLVPYQQRAFKPERVANYEIGYRGIFGKKLFVDAYYYYSVYTDFIGSAVLIQPTASAAPGLLDLKSGVFGGSTRRAFSLPANSSQDITASGWAIGLNYALNKGYIISGNIANNNLNNFVPSEEVQYSGFNTPKYRYNLTFTKRATNTSKIGFSVNLKHQDEFVWESSIVQPSEPNVTPFTNTIVPAINNLDAQVSYKLTGMKSIVKVGGTNILGTPYYQAYGSAITGSMVYVGLTFDELMR